MNICFMRILTGREDCAHPTIEHSFCYFNLVWRSCNPVKTLRNFDYFHPRHFLFTNAALHTLLNGIIHAK